MQPTFEIKFHPADLSRHGKNPYEQPIYRIVWADSRKDKVLHEGKMYTMPRYHAGEEGTAAGHWVLEKWAPAEVIVGMTRERYEQMTREIPDMALAEWPERGDYELCYVFRDTVDEPVIHRAIEQLEHRMRHQSKAERFTAAMVEEDKKAEAKEKAFDALYDEAREESQA